MNKDLLLEEMKSCILHSQSVIKQTDREDLKDYHEGAIMSLEVFIDYITDGRYDLTNKTDK